MKYAFNVIVTAVTGVAAAAAVATVLSARGVAQTADGVAGRWEFSDELPRAPGASGVGAGRGRGAAPPAERHVMLELRPGPGNTLTGRLDLGPGRAPGQNPQRPVEIADGQLEGTHLSFSAWEFDRYRNRVRYEGTLDGQVLKLTLTRATSRGPERIEVTARRPANTR